MQTQKDTNKIHVQGHIKIHDPSTGEIYKVKMTEYGFTCNCTAGQIRGKCKHAQYVGKLLAAD